MPDPRLPETTDRCAVIPAVTFLYPSPFETYSALFAGVFPEENVPPIPTALLPVEEGQYPTPGRPQFIYGYAVVVRLSLLIQCDSIIFTFPACDAGPDAGVFAFQQYPHLKSNGIGAPLGPVNENVAAYGTVLVDPLYVKLSVKNGVTAVNTICTTTLHVPSDCFVYPAGTAVCIPEIFGH
jgi:hypothetical protein